MSIDYPWYTTYFQRQVLAFIAQSTAFQEQVMSSFSDLATAQAALDAEIAKVDVDLKALIAKMGSVLSPADQAALDAEVSALRASTGTLSGVDTEITTA